MRKVSLVVVLAVLVAGVAYFAVRRSDDGAAAAPSSQFANSPGSSAPAFTPSASVVATSPTPPALPANEPDTKGPPSATCVEGWVTPPRNTPMFTDPLGIIRRTVPVDGEFVVVDLRTFVGPESPPSVGEGAKGYLQDIRRWYVKLYAADDLSYQGRFLVEQRLFGRGLSAVAPYDTEGFTSPDWVGFQFDSARPEPVAYPGLPGTWSGEPYDFVKGGGGLTNPGLPDEVIGCMRGT
ncbi:MAG TPA: hypothetical protein VI341_11735 [Actinomycetota bacterium]